MNELSKRTLTAAVLIPLVVAGVLWAPTAGVALALALVMLIGAQEWAELAGIEDCSFHLGFILAAAAGIAVSTWLVFGGRNVVPWFLVGGLWWLWAAQRVLRSPPVRLRQGPDAAAAISGLVVLVPAWAALVWMHQLPLGPQLVLSLLVLIWVADSGAYFVGRRWGSHKLARTVSPGKTWEGLLGALVGALVWGGVVAGLLGSSLAQIAGLLLLSLVTVLMSVVGDLYESLMKRERGVKDSGALLPGHGGVLDRIDSLTAAAPVFALGLHLVGLDQ
jgi:phosphatidate cytidylyltransferase